jgi:hypothetical protein
MPEYLAPGVYVEEIDLGSKPIEGVSTSTTGFVGVARRGPVNKPVFITSIGEYFKYFGGFLGQQPYGTLRWLPIAVDGYFSNGGKRAYVVRVAKLKPGSGEPLDTPVATVAQAVLPDQRDARRTLLRPAKKGEQEIDLTYATGLAVGDILQLGDGAEAEFVTITEFTNHIKISSALQFDHTAGVTVMSVSNDLTTLANPTTNAAGASAIRVATPGSLTANSWIMIEDGTDTEFLLRGATAPNGDVNVTPNLFSSHAAGRNVRNVTLDTTKKGALTKAAKAGDDTIQLDNVLGTLAQGQWIQLQANAGQDVDFVQVTGPVSGGNLPVSPKLRFPHDLGKEVVKATIVDPAATTLTAPAIISVASATGLSQNDLIMLEDVVRTEFGRLSAINGTELTLTTPLRFPHGTGVKLRKVTAPAKTQLSAAANADDDKIKVLSRNDLNEGSVLEILDGAQTEYLEVKGPGTAGDEVLVRRKLRYSHAKNTFVRLLQGTMKIIAGPSIPDPALYPEVGEWGNNIRVQTESASITRADVALSASKGDSALTLSTTQGIEAGSVLRLPGNLYVTVKRVEGKKVLLDSTLPAAINPATATNSWDKQVSTSEFTIRFTSEEADEVFSNLSMEPRHSNFFVTVINRNSQLVHVETTGNTTTPPSNQPLTTSAWYLGGGADELPSIVSDPGIYVGSDAADADRRAGLFALLNYTDISIVAVPGQTNATVQLALITHAERARYRFAVLDAEDNANLDRIQAQRSLYDSKYAALYYPWIQVFDPLEKKLVNAPPSGHTCGIYARTDTEVGVHKAPANAVVAQAQALQRTITQSQQDILNPKGINVIRAFPGRGIRIWGARTISSDPAWKYLNVRRLFIFLEQSIDNATQYAVFEPNDVPLWERLRGSVTAFLTTQWRNGMLQGRTVEQSFFVRVGLGETMTQDDIDNGRVIMLIGVAPVKPAEFVIFRITQMPRGSKVNE